MICYKKIHFFEETVKSGGIGEHLSSLLLENGYKDEFIIHAIENKFIKITIEDALKKVLTAKLERINFDFMDFYDNDITNILCYQYLRVEVYVISILSVHNRQCSKGDIVVINSLFDILVA